MHVSLSESVSFSMLHDKSSLFNLNIWPIKCRFKHGHIFESYLYNGCLVIYYLIKFAPVGTFPVALAIKNSKISKICYWYSMLYSYNFINSFIKL